VTGPAQPALLSYRNTGLFSDFFLERRLREVSGWDAEARAAADLQAELRGLYEAARANLDADANEAQTEQVFIRPVLDMVGFVYDVQTGLPAWGGAERPDYVVFPTQGAFEAALPARGRLPFYAGADAIVDAKAWGTNLDTLDRTQSRKTPSQQIGGYIQRANLDWGVLTNGRKWRLYTSSRERTIENYFEVDLAELLYAPAEDFRYFSCFFTPRAFVGDAEGRSFLDRVFAGSIAYAVEVGSVLRDRAYRVVELLAAGFSTGSGAPDRAELDRLYANSLIVLYRLLFCFYAEGRELLPMQNPSYSRLYSLSELKQRAAESIDTRLTLSRTGVEFWSRLSNLFALVDRGDPDLGMPEGYDGGLFDPAQHQVLVERAVPDFWLAEALDQLARIEDARTGQREFVDYGDLKIRDLGTVYEGLLEFRLDRADVPLWLVRRNGREVYTNEQPQRERPADVPAATLYLSNDRRERKASGSYYTPDYIVTAIVERTLEPLVKRASEAAGQDGAAFVTHLLGLRVLDPAMGSGHFLVEAADYLATQIATHPAVEAVAEGDESEVRAWRRRVAESCMFGVDRNPLAVELAKLSLWLATVSTGRPLSFLDHHLKVGNSLIGTRLDDLVGAGDLFLDALGTAARAIAPRLAQIAVRETSTKEDVQVKVAAEREIERLSRPFERIADQFVGQPFVTEPAPDVETVLAAGGASRSSVALRERFFHWELAFPDAFLTASGDARSDAGFDAVVMNPPYIRIQAFPREHADYFRRAYSCAHGSFNVYVLFVERVLALLAPRGRAGMIVPNVFFGSEYGAPLRGILAERRAVDRIIDFGDNQVFPEATNYTCLLFLAPERGAATYSTAPVGSSARELESAARAPEMLPSHTVDLSSFGGPWIFATGEVADLLEHLRTGADSLGTLAKRIFQGLITGADEVYILLDRGPGPGGTRRVWSVASKRELVLEPSLLHELASGEDVERYGFTTLSKLLLFPYRAGELIESTTLESETPLAWAYLRTHEQRLRRREGNRMDLDEGWYGFVRRQNLTLHDLPKLGVAATVRRLELAADPTGDVYFHNVRVNGILLGDEAPSLWFVLGLLNSRLLDFVFRRGAARHANGYYAANRQYIAPLPIRIGSDDQMADIAQSAERMAAIATATSAERHGFRTWLAGELGITRGLPEIFDRYETIALDKLLEGLRARRRDSQRDPSTRAFREQFEAELGTSRARLEQPLAEIRGLDEWLDAHVYDLYELTKGQRALVNSEYEPKGASE
jgi:hypothetical protein